MIGTDNHSRIARALYEFVGPMLANVVETPNLTVAAAHTKKVLTGHTKADEITGIGDF